MKQGPTHTDALRGWLERAPAPPLELVALLLEALDDDGAAVFAVDARREIVFWSDGAEALLGYARADVVGQHCLKANRCEQCMVGCGIAEYGAVHGVPLVLFREDGTRVAVRKTARAFFDAAGQFAGGLEILIPAAHESARSAEAATRAHGELPEVVEFHGLLSAEASMRRVFETCRNVAATEVSVLVRGESGTGKELLARALHAESARADGPFVAVNCAALTPSLIESELFGHVKGAFTGAVRDHAGIFARADRGTLFLDEVGDLPLEMQAKLLRVLEEGMVLPVGASRPQRVDVRVVAATHRALRAEVAAGRFREDLMYRLRVVPIFVPPLRERRADIGLLAWHFVAQRNRSGQRVVNRIAPDAMRALLDHRWPGNVRELRNVIDYAFAVARGASIERADLPPELRAEAPPPPGSAAPAALPPPADPAARIRAALAASGGHVGKAAELLGVSRPTLWRWRKKHGV